MYALENWALFWFILAQMLRDLFALLKDGFGNAIYRSFFGDGCLLLTHCKGGSDQSCSGFAQSKGIACIMLVSMLSSLRKVGIVVLE